MRKVDKKNVEDIMSLSPMQKGMLLYYLKTPESDIYFEQLSLEVEGELDFELFKKAWGIVADTNEMLRIIFRWEGLEEPLQIVLKQHELKINFNDFSLKFDEDIESKINNLLETDKGKRFDLHEVPFRITLCKLTTCRHIVVISNHHILYDGWSNGILLREFFQVYSDLHYGRLPKLLPKNKYKEFVKQMTAQDTAKQREYWRKSLEGIKSRQDISDNLINTESQMEIANYFVKSDMQLGENINNFATAEKTTLAAFFYCAWSILLHIYKSAGDVVFGTTVSGRNPQIKGIENMVGLFINTLPLRVKIKPEDKILDILKSVQNVLQERKEFENTSLVDIKKYCDIIGKDDLLQSIVILENYPIDKFFMINGDPLRVKAYSMFIRAEFDLILNIALISNLEFTICYNKNSYMETDIANIGDYFLRIIKGMLFTQQNAEFRIKDIELLDIEEKNRICSEIEEDSSKIDIDFDLDDFI